MSFGASIRTIVYFMDVDTSVQRSGDEPQLFVFQMLPPQPLLLFGFKPKRIEAFGDKNGHIYIYILRNEWRCKSYDVNCMELQE